MYINPRWRLLTIADIAEGTGVDDNNIVEMLVLFNSATFDLSNTALSIIVEFNLLTTSPH